MTISSVTAGSAAASALRAMQQAQLGVAQAAGRIVSGRTVDAADILALAHAQTRFEAAAATFVAADEMTGTLLDITA